MIGMFGKKDVISADDFEIDELREVVLGQSTRLSKAVALQLLGRKTYAGKFNDLKKILEDEEKESRVRYTAAIELGRLGSRKARKVLLKAINSKDRFVRRGVLESFALIGEEEEFGVIDAILQRKKDFPYARLTATRIAYRRGFEGYRIPFPKPERFVELDQSKVQEKELKLANRRTVKKCLKDIAKSVPDIDFSSQVMNLKVGESNWLFLLDKQYVGPQATSQLLRRKALIGVIAAKHTTVNGKLKLARVNDKWTPKHYIFTNPVIGKQLIQILVTTSKGTVAFAGTSKIAKGKHSFAIRTVKHPGAPLLQVEGSLSKEMLRFEKALFQPGRLPKKTPMKRPRTKTEPR